MYLAACVGSCFPVLSAGPGRQPGGMEEFEGWLCFLVVYLAVRILLFSLKV